MSYDIVILTDSRYENPTETNWYIDQVLLEDDLVKKALEQKGFKVIKKAWDALNFDWSKCDYAIFRTTWDYFERYDDFFKWFTKTQKVLQFINAPEVIYWNLDKQYLKELQQKQINIPATLFIEKGGKETLSSLFSKTSWEKAVLKPAIAGAARETFLVSSSDYKHHESNLQRLLSQEAMLFQEFQYRIQEQGEISIVMIGLEYSHAVLKKAKKGDFRVQDDFGGSVEKYNASKVEIDFATKALIACPHPTTYARVDVFYDNNNRLALGELELIEPELWFRNCPEAAHKLANSVFKFINSNTH
jgi:glutathione synthase/RimK-type ligase-like ATP-grasp enzyme